MPDWGWVALLGVVAWFVGGFLLALLIGRIILMAEKKQGPDA